MPKRGIGNTKNINNNMTEEAGRSRSKKPLIALSVLALVLVGIGTYTFSRYVSTGEVKSNATVAKWKVMLDGEPLSGASVDKTLVVDPSDEVAGDAMAPGRSGKVEFELDPTGSEVSIDYSVEMGDPQVDGEDVNAPLKVLAMTYKIGSGAEQEAVANEAGVFEFKQPLSSVTAGEKVTITAQYEWSGEDSDEANEADNAAVDFGEITIPVKAIAKQHV